MLQPVPLSKAKLAVYSTLPDKRGRQKHGLFLAEGVKLVHEALLGNWPVECVVLLAEAGLRRWQALLPQWPEAAQRVPVALAQPHEYRQLSDQPNPEGVLAVLRLPQPVAPEAALQLPAFALHEVQDPGNLGTLLRTADWFGFRAVYCSRGTVDCFNPKVVRSAMGSVLRVPVLYTDDITAFVAQHAEHALAAVLGGEPLSATAVAGRRLVVLGAETHGLPPELARCPGVQPVAIPGRGGAESLNVAVAGGILAYAVTQL
jgi:TrmH family RNA methyltransferase